MSTKESTLSKYETEAEKFSPSKSGCGALLKVKRDLSHVMRLIDNGEVKFKKGDTIVVLYDFVNKDNGERALILLSGESRHMYMTLKFDEDFEVLHKGTSDMQITEQ